MKITINGTITALAAAVMLAGCGAVDDGEIAGAAERRAETQTQTETAAPVTEVTAVTSAETEQTQQADATLSAEILTDIRLWADKKEINADGDSGEVIWSCEIPAGFSPDKIRLVEADTYKYAGELNDIADFEKYGGDITGDGVYNCRFTVDTHIDTDPDVSEQKTFKYYAEFFDGKDIHRSEPAEITVCEPFTEKELDEMEAVENEIQELMDDEGFKALDTEGKREKMLALLNRLAEEQPPLVVKESIYSYDDMITYQHICGINSGIKLEPFDPMMN